MVIASSESAGRGSASDTSWEFLTAHEAETVEAMTSRIFPSDPDRPGAREARVVRFIDRALADASQELGSCYRIGAEELDRLCHQDHGSSFADLDEAVQDKILLVIDQSSATATDQENDKGVAETLSGFFEVVREHTIQGMFCDPEYGGNHETVGWQLIGFPGAQWGYSAEQMRPDFDAKVIPIKTLDDLRRDLRSSSSEECKAGKRKDA